MKRITLNAALVPSRPSALVFALPGILPEQTRLLLDQEARTVLLLSIEEAELAPPFYSFQLTPSASQVLLSLLQAYPGHCSYRTLFSALFPLPSQEEEWERVWEKNLAIRPIRRALAALTPALQTFGLQVISLRGRGYVLASAVEPTARKPPNEEKYSKKRPL